MNRLRKQDIPLVPLVPGMVRRLGCILIVLCVLVSMARAEDFGLVNPAEKDFSEFNSDANHQGTFAKRSPNFKDRSLPASSTPPKAGVIRQVSTFDDPFPVDDSFPVNSQPPAPQYAGDPNAYSPNAYSGHAAMQTMTMPNMGMPNMAMYNMYGQGMYGQGIDPNYAALYLQQYQYPQQYQPQHYLPDYTVNGMNPYGTPYADMYSQMVPQFGYAADPYAMMYQAEQAEMPDYSSVYHAVMMQEMARQQAAAEQADKEKAAEEAQKKANENWSLQHLMPVRVTSPLGKTMLDCAKTLSPFCSPTGPDKGVGMPLVGKSWLDHPYYFGGFVGQMTGSELVERMIKQKNGGYGGLTFGYNYNEYWGLESRLHFASISIYDTKYAKQIISDMYPDVTILPTTRTNELVLFDLAVHYYPLGNAKWRPYCKYGLGFGHQKFVNSFGREYSKGIATMPMGLGLRYWWNERLSLQGDITDNIIFASGIAKTQHNFGFTIGIMYAFGTGRTQHPVHYWPATPSMGSKW